MILITSAAYIKSSLASELSLLPPTMLPVQNKRLYEHQIKLFENTKENIFISLPKSYKLNDYDNKILNENNINVIYVPDEFNLGQSIVYCLNVINKYNESLYILHGDTLFNKIELKTNNYIISNPEDNYSWTLATDNNVYAGFFSFENQSFLIKLITENNYDFIKAIKDYKNIYNVTEIINNNWYDFSLVNTYYRSISKLTTQRVFNSLESTSYSIRKSSDDSQKMIAEAQWINDLPKQLKHYVPALWDQGIRDDDKYFYEIEYLYMSSLANLFVFTEHPQFVWKEIMNACITFINDIFKYTIKNPIQIATINNNLFYFKTVERLEKFYNQTNISLDKSWIINGINTPSLREIAKITGDMIKPNATEFVSLMHGDFCFSNILYDFKSKSIKVIDPRGINPNGIITQYGDIRYDIAKLAHSIIGLYDYIIAGRYDITINDKYNIDFNINISNDIKEIQKYFINQKFGEYNINDLDVYPIMIQLFLSMLPLHNDNKNRQQAILANVLKIFTTIL